jgi:hypothetical protein
MSLVEFLCDKCSLRLGGDLGATARALSAVQNDVYTTGIMMQLQKLCGMCVCVCV